MSVANIMGSKADWPTMKHAADRLDRLGVDYETKIVSAHRLYYPKCTVRALTQEHW